MAHLLEISNLSVSITDKDGKVYKLIDNVSLTVNEGEAFGLVGETGSGKSILAKILGGYIQDNWHIECKSFRFDNKEVLINHNTIDTAYLSSRVGVIHQDPTAMFDPSQKISKQLLAHMRHADAFKNKKYSSIPWIRRAQQLKEIENLLTRIGIKDPYPLLNSYPNEISDTSARLMNIALAVLLDPVLLIADEPTVGLNTVSEQRVRSLFKRLNANFQKTIVYLSNNYETVKDIVKSVNIMYFGQIVEKFSGVKDLKGHLVNYSHHPYTNLLLKSSIDFADCKLSFKSRLYAIPGGLPELSNIPIGCRFAAKCQFAQRDCMKTPKFTKDRQGYSSFACHHPIDFFTIKQSEQVQEYMNALNEKIESELVNNPNYIEVKNLS